MFGDRVGFDFNSGTPIGVTACQHDGIEGAACISNSNGCLLFYTDGDTIWDSSHNVMSNGTGLNPNVTPTMCGTIIPRPGSATLYEVFSIDGMAGSGGLRHAVVDITLNNGLGQVTSKNNAVLTPVAEKIVAIKHANGVDIWIVVHKYNSNQFYSYLVTANGLQTTPVISTVGVVHSNTTTYQGWMQANTAGDRIALALPGGGNLKGYYLYDFNKTNGSVSNEVAITNFGFSLTWGVEFSPNGNYLYGNGANNQVVQFDLNAGTGAQIAASKVVVGTFTTPVQVAHSLQMGPDQKIYMSAWQGTHLAVINDPDSAGTACNFIQNGAAKVSGTLTASIPYFPKFLLKYNNPQPCQCNLVLKAEADSAKCFGDSTGTLLVEAPNAQGTVKYLWNTGDTTSQIVGLTSGFYTVTVTDSAGCSKTDSFFVPQPQPSFVSISGPDSICPGDCATLKATVNGNSGPYFFNWFPLVSKDDTIFVCPDSATTYELTVTDGDECPTEQKFHLSLFSKPIAGFEMDSTSGCDSLCVNFQGVGGMSSWIWSFGDGDSANTQNPTHCYDDTGTYDVKLIVTDMNGCVDSAYEDSVITVTPCVGIADAMQILPLEIFPNPNGGEFSIRFPNQIKGKADIRIFDPTGKEVWHREHFVGDKGNRFTTKLAPGTYFIRIKSESDILGGKLLIH